MTRVSPRSLALPALLLVAPVVLAAQGGGGGGFQGRPPKNLQVLPKSLTGAEVTARMRVIALSLGVRCEFCHVQSVGADGREQFDHASDDKEMKKVAREMMKMVNDINEKYLATSMGKTLGEREQVTCETCHHGLAKPRTIQAAMLDAIEAKGADSAVALYRSLRTRYLERGAYDFSEVPLSDIGRVTTNRPAAIALLKLNLEFYPKSVRSFQALAQQSLQTGDTAAAIDALTKASAIDPNDGQVRNQLNRLRGNRPPPR